ncbi:hypothetical protein MZO42_08690 [Sphingomonas psychrotolerans]|uniref:AI-2E family transporter n=1 Tax=Sphingomonas psychrotolerans TaxID=1327635 RepID=A0ABU3N2J1_9SPHN|nr:hypothetical protein [Sphingomonas psychrotolerans]MDT8758774.1 hypothetical protein [Sphingomonas psychrotolerans]
MTGSGLFGGLAGRIGQQSFWAVAAALVLAGLVLNQIPIFGPVLAMLLL